MMKLYDMAMAISDPEMQVTLIDDRSGRICFERTAEDLLDYSGIDYRRVSRVNVRNNRLELSIR